MFCLIEGKRKSLVWLTVGCFSILLSFGYINLVIDNIGCPQDAPLFWGAGSCGWPFIVPNILYCFTLLKRPVGGKESGSLDSHELKLRGI